MLLQNRLNSTNRYVALDVETTFFTHTGELDDEMLSKFFSKKEISKKICDRN
jgi:hypothetical protein